MLRTLKPPPFEYHAPRTVDEVLDLLAEHGDDARPLAGGQSLVPLMSLRLAGPAVLVDVTRAGLDTVTTEDGWLTLGATVRERAAERSALVAERAPLLAAALPLVGHPAIRARGTVGGSLAHADPAGELPAVVVALDAEVVAASRARGRRTIAAADLYDGYFTTVLEPDEVLTEVRLPAPPPASGAAFEEVARRHGDFAMAGVAATVTLGPDGSVAEARLALSGVAETPVRAREAEAVLVGRVPDDGALAAAAEAATAGLSPPSDLHGSSAYRRHVAGVLVRRALRAAAERAGGDRG